MILYKIQFLVYYRTFITHLLHQDFLNSIPTIQWSVKNKYKSNKT
jgi:hypothetical protein